MPQKDLVKENKDYEPLQKNTTDFYNIVEVLKKQHGPQQYESFSQ